MKLPETLKIEFIPKTEHEINRSKMYWGNDENKVQLKFLDSEHLNRIKWYIKHKENKKKRIYREKYRQGIYNGFSAHAWNETIKKELRNRDLEINKVLNFKQTQNFIVK